MGLEFYVTAFQQVRTDVGMGGQLPFMALCSYARMYGIEGAEFERFVTILTKVNDDVEEMLKEKEVKATPVPPNESRRILGTNN